MSKSSRGKLYESLCNSLYEKDKAMPDLAAIASDLQARMVSNGMTPLLVDVETDKFPPEFIAEGLTLASKLTYMDSPMLEISRSDAIAMAAIMAGEAELAHEQIKSLTERLEGRSGLILPSHLNS